jgi:uncharacterized membrane protein YtjA (UPF0391 family)
MRTWSAVLLIVALVAGTLGFRVLAGPAATLGKVLAIVFLALFVLRLLAKAIRGEQYTA